MKYSEDELESLVQAGELDEESALRLLASNTSSFVPRASSSDVNKAFKAWQEKKLSEDVFYQTVLRYVATIIKSHSHDAATFSAIEDAITTSTLKLWRNIDSFDPNRGSFSRFVTVVTLSEIRNLLGGKNTHPFRKKRRKEGIVYICRECSAPQSIESSFCTECGNTVSKKQQVFGVYTEEADTLPAKGLSPEQRVLFDDWMHSLSMTDSCIVKMWMDGLTQEEIGQTLGMSQAAVAARLSRLRTTGNRPF